MGGVCRIQTFLNFHIFFIYKAPKRSLFLRFEFGQLYFNFVNTGHALIRGLESDYSVRNGVKRKELD